MSIHELAGQIAPRSILVNVPRLVTAYYEYKPDVSDPAQRVAFGTSGHRGSSIKMSFNEEHILAISQAIWEHRKAKGITGPLFIGIDTHALSEPALATALGVFAARGTSVVIQKGLGYTPTPAISHAILTYNRGRQEGLADGIVITPSHNPPEDGGFKYNPPEGGPADTQITKVIETRANELLAAGLKDVSSLPLEKALRAETTREYDFVVPYVKDLAHVIDMETIAGAGLKIGVDPLGGASISFWDPISEIYHIPLDVVDRTVDPTFAFMTLDKDGKIRMDCSSAYAMARLIRLKESYDVAFGNDTDGDRHGIVTRGSGLLDPNHYLSAAVWYLFRNRPGWRAEAAVGKTIVSTSMLDRVALSMGRRLFEVPVGFKWFVEGLIDGSYGFGGEESAGASFLRKDGTVWTTDKDGIIMDLLACEMTARTGKDPGLIYGELEEKFGQTFYARIDAPATAEQKTILKGLSPEMVKATELAGAPIMEKLTRAPGNGGDIGGLKVTSTGGWFAARPSGTEEVYKIYAESFRSSDHLKKIQEEAVAMVAAAFAAAGA